MMTHTDNKVEWCMRKAQKELEKDGLHRGLVKTEPDIKVAQKHLDKAKHNLEAAHFFNDNGYSDWSASAFFYCIYHCFLAILSKYGYESRNQECTLAVIEMLSEKGIINIDTRFVDMLNLTKMKETDLSIIKIREDFQYGTDIKYEKQGEFEFITSTCEKMIKITTDIIHMQ